MPRASRKKQISFSCREMVSRIWQKKAASLYREGYAPYILPSGRYSITLGKFAGVQSKKKIYGGDYETEWEF